MPRLSAALHTSVKITTIFFHSFIPEKQVAFHPCPLALNPTFPPSRAGGCDEWNHICDEPKWLMPLYPLETRILSGTIVCVEAEGVNTIG